MGWTGVYDIPENPKEYVLNDYNYESDKVVSEVAAAGRNGSTIYGAVKVKIKDVANLGVAGPYQVDENNCFVYGVVILTKRRKGEFLWKQMDETAGPYYWDCPAKVLKLLSPIISDERGGDNAKKWRENCNAKPVTAKIPMGAVVTFKKPLTFRGVPANGFKKTILVRRGRKTNVFYNDKIGYCRINMKNYGLDDYTVAL